MKILFLTHTFNSLSQRLYVELIQLGHEVSVEFDINDAITIEAAKMFRPALIVAPFLKRAIPESIWRNHICIVIHPGIKGDRGPSALDWAIINEEDEWGVTVLQANNVFDAGDIWSTTSFKMRNASKSSLYRNEVADASVAALLETIERIESRDFQPEALDYGKQNVRGIARPLIKQTDRAIDWMADSADEILRKIRSADGFPGLLDEILSDKYYLYNACNEDTLHGRPGEIVAKRNGAILRATVDGAVWITHLKKTSNGEENLKLPAEMVLGNKLSGVPESPVEIYNSVKQETFQDIRYEEKGMVGYLHFNFYNGAMSASQCKRLKNAYRYATSRNTRVIVLMGGRDFWSNGIHLNVIEAAKSPADESWQNINAMNDLTQAILLTYTHITVSAMQANAGAGGVFLAIASDRVLVRNGIILNPHYKNMGNLYGSEYWTYLLPKRVGDKKSGEIMENRLPIGASAAKEIGLADDCFGENIPDFLKKVEIYSKRLTESPHYEGFLSKKRDNRLQNERIKPLEDYRKEELEKMKLNFYGFDPSYHVARYNFVHKVPQSWTPRHLAKHRR